MKTTMIACLVLGLTVMAFAAPPPGPFGNGFEVDDDGWFNLDRVPRGTNGILSSQGDWHAEVPAGGGSFTRWGGYSGVFPAGGYVTSVDIYLDAAASTPGDDLRFDYTSAISDPSDPPNHRRDFVFSVGTDGAGDYVMSASNNAYGWPANPGRDPLFVPAGDWYTFQHYFYDDGTGVLAVDMSVLDAAGTLLQTWTLSDPTDVIGGTVGGNRYGWFVPNDFPFLAIDASSRTGSWQAVKEGVAGALADMLPTGDKKTDRALGKAVAWVEKSLTPDYWAGDNEPSAVGNRIFDYEKKAVGELMKIRDPDPAIGVAIDALIGVDRALAQAAVAAMTELDSRQAANAAAFYQKALDAVASGKFDRAVGYFGKAFQEARKATNP